MYRYYFRNLETGKEFYIEEENPSLMKSMIRKSKYSKKIEYLGRTKVWG